MKAQDGSGGHVLENIHTLDWLVVAALCMLIVRFYVCKVIKTFPKMLKNVGMPQCQKPQKLGVGMAVYRQDRL